MAELPPPTDGWDDLSQREKALRRDLRPQHFSIGAAHAGDNPFLHFEHQRLTAEVPAAPFFSQTSSVATMYPRSPSPQALPLVSIALPLKAKSHRKRHVPVGPAGIWFQSSQSSNTTGTNGVCPSERTSAACRHNAPEEEELEMTQLSQTQAISTETSRNTHVAFYSPAWMAMQVSLGFVTPSLPAHFSPWQKYRAVRPHLPSQYLLLRDLERVSWKLPSSQTLLVVVESIQALAADHVSWIVTLTDETQETMAAWIQPRLVADEEQRAVPKYLRVGVVWALSDKVTLSLKSAANNDSNDEDEAGDFFIEEAITHNETRFSAQLQTRSERLLLIREENIQQAWAPSHAELRVSDEDYIRWVERRSALRMDIADTLVTTIEAAHGTPEVEKDKQSADQNASTCCDNSDSSSDEEEAEFEFPVSKQNVRRSVVETDADTPTTLSSRKRNIRSAPLPTSACPTDTQTKHRASGPDTAAPSKPQNTQTTRPFSFSQSIPIQLQTTRLHESSPCQFPGKNQYSENSADFCKYSSQRLRSRTSLTPTLSQSDNSFLSLTVASAATMIRSPVSLAGPSTKQNDRSSRHSSNPFESYALSRRPSTAHDQPLTSRANGKKEIEQAVVIEIFSESSGIKENKKPTQTPELDIKTSESRTRPPCDTINYARTEEHSSTSVPSKKRRKSSLCPQVKTGIPSGVVFPSSLWATTDASFLDCIENENDNISMKESCSSLIPVQEPTIVIDSHTNVCDGSANSSRPIPAKKASALFQAGALDGIADLEGLFDE
jgi:hypothetical protein